MLSGIVSKAAAYGFLRIAIAKFPGPTEDFRTPLLVLAAVGLVYGSLLAFRAPDVRGVIAYSSLAQMGLITLGLFAANDLGFNGAVLQMVNHGLISATLFLLAGAIERRTATGEFLLLGGMARGRPALATLLMTTGVIALAVPGSSAFAGEFLVLAGVFQQYWLYAVVGAVAIVLAAMYMLRLISGVLHRDVGSAVSDAARDLRPGRAGDRSCRSSRCLLALSVWPAAVSEHSFPTGYARRTRQRGGAGRGSGSAAATPAVPHGSMSTEGGIDAVKIDDAARRLADALARAVAARRGRGLPAWSPCSSPRRGARAARRVLRARRLRDRRDLRGRRLRPQRRTRRSRSATRSRATGSARSARSSSAAAACSRSSCPTRTGCATTYVAEYYALLATAGAGMCFLLQAHNLMTLFLGLEWFSIALYIICAIDMELETSLESGPQVPDHRLVRLGRAALRLGARLRRDRASSSSRAIAANADSARRAAARGPRDDARRPRATRRRRRRSTSGRPTSTRARRRR